MGMSEPVSYIDGVLRRVRRSESGDEFEYYVGMVTSDIVKDITFVPAYDDPYRPFPDVLNARFDDGYQRAGETSRMNKFAKFLEDNPLSIVPPVILSTRGKWQFIPGDSSEDYGKLEILDQAAILDGQHRIGGFVKKFQSDHIPLDIDFIALGEIPLQRERLEFTELNTNQNRVSPSLLVTLQADSDTNPDAWIALQLDERPDSPFHQQIGHQSIGPTHLFNMATMTKNVGRMFRNGAFNGLPPEEKIQIAIQYWDTIGNLHNEQWKDIDIRPRKNMEYKLLEATGLIAWSLIAPEILARYFDPDTRTINWDGVETIITAAVGLDWSKKGEFAGRTGEAGGNHIKEQIQFRIAGFDLSATEIED